ncbi:oligopeptide:H+ symporter [Agromyces mediolanus]|uniref:peptide MFS transporter n=1 Tax=Agromyces mediolanus TaxID=41986 RepID=UPI00203A4CCD|nr:oligopeptide:H+ symporter [Agromyces mediolanus]MCM3658165.1 oligopeptide:H+ symporter [Agromyces mediolanus]
MEQTLTRPRTFAGLPRTLYPVAGLTVFDTTTFFGLQSLLVYYIYFATDEGGLGFSVDSAIAISAAFGACTYLATIVMGWFADRVIGAGRALGWGAWIAAVGYLAIGLIPGPIGLAIGLVGVVIGASSMWVGESALVGGALNDFPTKRESGFTIYYVGGASGAFIGVLLAGILQSSVGFTIGFVISAVVLVTGRLLYSPFRRRVELTAPRVAPEARATPGQIVAVAAVVSAAAIILVAVVASGLNPATVIGAVSVVYAIVFFTKLLRDRSLDAEAKRSIVGYLPFFVATFVFNGLYQQLYGSVAVYSEGSTDRAVLGMELPPSTILAAAPLCSIFLAPILAIIWGKLGSRQPSLAVKFGTSFAICSSALLLLALSSASGEKTPVVILALIVLAFGAADIVVTPSGLSLASLVGPPAFSTRMIAVQYLGIAGGIALAGTAGEWFNPGSNEAMYFGICAIVGISVAVGMFATPALLRRFSGSRVEGDAAGSTRTTSVGR